MPSGRKGFFISFEGGDGAGKSSQIGRLADMLRADGHTVRITREPGGSDGAEVIRKLLVEGAAERWSPMTEALMMYAARADHLEKIILPALDRGEVVITDRFADSSMAYQGIAGALGPDIVKRLHSLVVGANDPDITIILDVPTEIGLSRAGGRGASESRFESKGAAYQERVRQAFLEIARKNPDRCVVIDATPDEATVFRSVASAVKKALQSRP